MFTLAHLSDPHLGALAWPGLPALAGKRALGFATWHLRRKKIHDRGVLPALVEDLHRARPDHIAVTGDLTNLSLPAEFVRAGAWLTRLSDAAEVTVIPGNHDAYVDVPWEHSLAHWESFMSGAAAPPFADEQPVRSVEDFPFVRLRGPLALVGLSSAAPMPAFSAAGRLGPGQLGRLAGQLEALGQQGCFRVVLIHHPPLPGGAKPSKQLQDSAGLREVIASRGAELVLFGHTHSSGLDRLATPHGQVPVIGVPSASSSRSRHGKHARYHLYRISREGEGWNVTVEVRGVDPSLAHFAGEGRYSLAVPH
jgi:3',5'-cyclic AMP phosphodiesterase CpdA